MPESPKYLLMHADDRVAAEHSLQYYQGNRRDTDLVLNEMLKESLDARMSMKLWEALREVFRQDSSRRAVCVGIMAIQVRGFRFKKARKLKILKVGTLVVVNYRIDYRTCKTENLYVTYILHVLAIHTNLAVDLSYNRAFGSAFPGGFGTGERIKLNINNQF